MSCLTDDDCQFQYFCNLASNTCQHYQVFPIRAYPMFVYILIPIFVAICNLGGLSAGAFRILLLMNMLNYTVTKATSLIYIVITAGALANFLTIVPKRHPKINTSLVDYNLVYIMMPTLVYGTDLGVLLNKLLIELVQHILVSIVLLFFGVVYTKKFMEMRKQARQLKDSEELITESNVGANQDMEMSANSEKAKFQKEESGLKLKSVLGTFVIFIIVQLLGSITEGAIFDIEHCTGAYYGMFAGFTVTAIVLIFIIYRIILRNMQTYKRVGFEYQIPLDQPKVFGTMVLGGFLAGLVQGLVGLGSGFIVIFYLLRNGVIPQVASAVSGYIILFVGSASLLQALVIGSLGWEETVFLFSLTFAGSLIITIIARNFLKGKSNAADAIIILILAIISILSLVGVGINIGMRIESVGFGPLIEMPDFCAI